MSASEFIGEKQKNLKSTNVVIKEMVRNRILLPALVLVICLIISYVNWSVADASRKNELKSYFEYRARDVKDRIEKRLIDYQQILKSTRGLYNASSNIVRTEFGEFFNSLTLDNNYQGIQGIGFSLIIPAEQIESHVAAIRSEGFPEYKVFPEGNRETYTSIIYLEPIKDLNLRALGYDMFSEPVRRKAMKRSRDANEAVITGKVNLVQETGIEVQAGFLIYLPVYRKGTPHNTLSERRSNIIGWVYSPFRMDDFMKGLFGELAADLELEIYDGKNISNETRMYSSITNQTEEHQQLAIIQVINFSEHEWTVFLKFTILLESRIGFSPTIIILAVGIGLSILLTIITWLLVNNRMRTIIVNNERKQIGIALKKIQEEQQIILDNIPAWVFYKDPENRFISVNKPFADVMGKSIDQLEGKSLFDIFPKEQAESYWNDDMEVLTSGNPKVGIIEPMESSKGIIWVQTDKIPYRDMQGKVVGLVGFSIDITDRKIAEDELNKSHEQLTKLNAEKDKFFSIIAHDLKSPFNGFIGLTELMADKTEKFSLNEFTENSKSLNKAAKNLYRLLENLLEWAQIQNGSINFAPKDCDLSKIFLQCIDSIAERAKQKRIEIVNEICNPHKVYVDERMISTVLRNLLSNAVKFTRMDGKIIVKSKNIGNGTSEVSVEDNGVGIPKSDTKRLFRTEEKVSTNGTEGELSTGLGLLLCKEFVEMHGGKIWVESKENIGSTFSFTLPEESRNEDK